MSPSVSRLWYYGIKTLNRIIKPYLSVGFSHWAFSGPFSQKSGEIKCVMRVGNKMEVTQLVPLEMRPT